MAFGPAQIHPHEHLGPVRRVHPAGLGPDGHQRLARVVLAVEQGAHLELANRAAQRVQLPPGLLQRGFIVLFRGEVEHDGQVVQARAQVLDPAQLALGVGQPAGHRLCVLLVVPQIR